MDSVVPFIDLTREYEEIGTEMLDVIEDVLANGYFILGDHVNRFEATFSDYIGVEHAVGVNSGSDALYLAVRALGIGKGDDVIVPSHSFVSTADAVVRNGARPVFVDINPQTYTIDPSAVAENVTEKTEAVIPVHLYGQPADMDAILEIAAKHDLSVVEDAAQAHGATYHSRPVGTLGHVACYSFYPTKNLGTYGDGGAVVTNDGELDDRFRRLREYGSIDRYQYESVAVNSRLDELQAAVLNRKLNYLDEFNDRRQEVASTYDELLSGIDGVTTPYERDDTRHVYHLYVVRTERRDALQEHLAEEGIQTLIHYPTPIHRQLSYRDRGWRGDLATTETVTDEILSLPMHPWFRDDEVRRVVEAIRSFG